MLIESALCIALKDLSADVMTFRQSGINKQVLIQLVNANLKSNLLTVGIIDAAYKQQIEHVEQHKLNAVTQFSSRVFNACENSYEIKTNREINGNRTLYAER